MVLAGHTGGHDPAAFRAPGIGHLGTQLSDQVTDDLRDFLLLGDGDLATGPAFPQFPERRA